MALYEACEYSWSIINECWSNNEVNFVYKCSDWFPTKLKALINAEEWRRNNIFEYVDGGWSLKVIVCKRKIWRPLTLEM